MSVLTYAGYNQWRNAVLNAIEDIDYSKHPDDIAHDVMSENHNAMQKGDGLALAAAYAKSFALVRSANSKEMAWAAWHTGKVPMFFNYDWIKIEAWIKGHGMMFEMDSPNPKRIYTLFRGDRLRGMSWTDEQSKAEYYAKWRYRQGENLMLHKIEIKESDILAKRTYSESWTGLNGKVRHTEISEFIISTSFCNRAIQADFIHAPTLKDHAINIGQRMGNFIKDKNIEHPSQLALKIMRREEYHGME